MCRISVSPLSAVAALRSGLSGRLGPAYALIPVPRKRPLARVVARDLDGPVRLDYAPSGVTWDARVRL